MGHILIGDTSIIQSDGHIGALERPLHMFSNFFFSNTCFVVMGQKFVSSLYFKSLQIEISLFQLSLGVLPPFLGTLIFIATS